MKRWQIGQLLGVEIWMTQSSLLLSGLLWLVFAVAGYLWLDFTLGIAALMGLTAVFLHWIGELLHQLGHAWVARRIGYPMQRIVSWTLLSGCRYPKDEPPLHANIHIQRALGGPVASLLIGLLSGFLLLLANSDSLFYHLTLFFTVENLFVFFIGALLPLGFTDGSTLLKWWPRRHEPI